MKMISVSGDWFFRRVGPLLQSLPRRPPAPFYQTRTHGGDGDDGDSTCDGGDGDSTGTHVMVVMVTVQVMVVIVTELVIEERQ